MINHEKELKTFWQNYSMDWKEGSSKQDTFLTEAGKKELRIIGKTGDPSETLGQGGPNTIYRIMGSA